MLVTWPFVMLLLDYWPLRRFNKSSVERHLPRAAATALVREKLPLFGIAAASCVVTMLAQSRGGAVRTFAASPVALRLSNAVVSYAKYLLLTFWPNDLAVYYPFGGIPTWQIIGAAFLLIGITLFCFSQRRIRPYLIVGWLWFLGTLVPLIGIVQVGGQIMADRYFYIPSIGLFMGVVFGLADIVKSRRVAAPLSAGIAVAILAILAMLTNAQIHRWRDSFALFEHTLLVTPPNFRIEHNLGVALAVSGRYDEAAAHFEKALQINPNFYDGLVVMGITCAHQGRVSEAVEYFRAAIHSEPDMPKARVQLARALWKENRDEAALEEMRRALQLAPEDADVRADLGLALARLGRIQEAINELHEALRLNANSAEAHNNLGLALLGSGRARESIPEFEEALRLKPKLEAAADNLRRAQAQLKPQ
jgi:Flp pilus assembly protein TadD